MRLVAALPYFQLGPWQPVAGWEWLKIHSFGMFVAIGLIVCLWMATWRGEKKLAMNGEKVQNYGLFLILVGWSFAHVFNVIAYHPGQAFETVRIFGSIPIPRVLAIWGSVSSYGGLLGGIIGIWLWRWMHPEDDFILWVDHASWTLTFAWMFGRLGCSSVHDHLGATASSSWPLAFKMTTEDLQAFGIPNAAEIAPMFRHDLGFYEFLWWGVIVAVVLLVDRKPRRKGIYTVIVPLLYAPARFFFDFFRTWPIPEDGDYDVPAHTQWMYDLLGLQPQSFVTFEGRVYIMEAPLSQYENLPADFFVRAEPYLADTRYWGFTPAQWLSIGLVILGVAMWFHIKDNEVVEWREYDPSRDR